MDIKISVITPLYNCSKYIEEALDCIISQNFRDFELILIDDGSTDRTYEIAESYQKKDNRIVLFRNESNQGAAFSRNFGLNQAKGKYVIFLDGDDVFLPDLLSKLYICAEEKNAQIVLCDYIQLVSPEINTRIPVKHNDNFKRNFCSNCFSAASLKSYYVSFFYTSLGGFLFNTDFIRNNNIEFQNLSSSNDVFFTFYSFLIAERIIWVDEQTISWYQRIHNEESRISSHRCLRDEYDALFTVGNELKKNNLLTGVHNFYVYKCLIYFATGILNEKQVGERKAYHNYLCREGLNDFFSTFVTTDNYNNILHEYVNCFKKNDADFEWFGEWYDRTVGFMAILDSKIYDIKKLFENKEIIVWGAGYFGVIFVDFCRQNDLRLRAIVDNNETKFNGKLFNYSISNISVINNSDLVIITPQNKEGIEKECKIKDYNYICLFDYIEWVE